MTADFFDNHRLPFPAPAEEMGNEAFPFLYYQSRPEPEPVPESSSTDQPRSRSRSVSDVSGAQYTRLSPVKFKETKSGRSRKHKKTVEEEKKKKSEGEEPPLGYIHVRARRGQATDSHSLAERVRREKISERMKVLQGLVPGCEKVVGKALMLDEIINYVQSLQNQVEFLSMKLACVNPMLFDSVDYDCLVNQTQFEVVGSMQQHTSVIQPTPLDQTTPKTYEHIINPLLLQRQAPMPLAQENGSLYMQVGDQRSQELINYIAVSNMCSFQ